MRSGKTVKPSKELQEHINNFETRWRDSNIADAARPNYDVYKINFLSKKGKLDEGTMDFQTMRSMIGDDVVETSFEKLPSGFLKYKNLNKPVVSQGDDFLLHPLELEKYKLERMIRQNPNMSVGHPKFARLTEPGGKDYTELVFSLRKGGMDIGIPTEISKKTTVVPKGTIWGVDRFVPEKIAMTPFKSPAHMNVKSEIAHVRFKTRDLNGKKVLTVEEMQSDFGIAASRGFANRPDIKITDFPFKQNWYELTIKRLIRYAADNGFDAIAIPKGSLAATRYGSSIDKLKKIEIQTTLVAPEKTFTKQEIVSGKYWSESKQSYADIPDKNIPSYDFTVLYYDDAGKIAKETTFTNADIYKLEKEIGIKEFSKFQEKIENILLHRFEEKDLAKADIIHSLEKTLVTGSGAGKFRLYDQAIPSFMKKYAKKWNAKVYDDVWDGSKEATEIRPGQPDLLSPGHDRKIPLTILEITPEMKKAVQEGSQSLFEILGFLTAGGITAKAVSDSQQNNSISN